MDIQCYSQRLLNPFRGVINVNKYQSAEAVTTDGINWDIYVSNEELLKDLDDSQRVQISDIRYGKWSKQKGLKRGPLYPSKGFINWQAAWTLLLDSLDDTTCQQFEVKARQQALVVANQYKLYPDIIDQESINCARVEARMRNSTPSEEPQDKTMSTFYIELNPGPTD